MILLDGILSPGQLIISTLILAIDLSFLLGSFKLKQSDKPSLNKKKKINLSSIKRKTLTIIGWIYMVKPGYGHLSLKAPLCWKWLNHTKNDQPGNYETRLGAL